MAELTLENSRGEIVARLYILPDGCLHVDSWLAPQGWASEDPIIGGPGGGLAS